MHFTLDQTIALQAAQSLGQHFLRDAADGALELGITPRPARQDLNDERGPFIRDPIEHES